MDGFRIKSDLQTGIYIKFYNITLKWIYKTGEKVIVNYSGLSPLRLEIYEVAAFCPERITFHLILLRPNPAAPPALSALASHPNLGGHPFDKRVYNFNFSLPFVLWSVKRDIIFEDPPRPPKKRL